MKIENKLLFINSQGIKKTLRSQNNIATLKYALKFLIPFARKRKAAALIAKILFLHHDRFLQRSKICV